MSIPSALIGAANTARTLLTKYRALVVLILSLAAVTMSTNIALRGQLLPSPGSGNQASGAPPIPDLARTCTSEGTLFEGGESLEDIRHTFKKEVSKVVAEREEFLQTPSKWTCPKSIDEESQLSFPLLEELAEKLPGWSYEYQVSFGGGLVPVVKQKPVTFENFSSILGELLREYECRLVEMQDIALPLLLRNADIPEDSQYCCIAEECHVASDPSICQGAPTSDPLCGRSCPVILTTADAAERLPRFAEQLQTERTRARSALERTVLALRSAEMNYGYARDLSCYARAALDLRSELGLLADAMSCMPKIWDAVTSLHDRKK